MAGEQYENICAEYGRSNSCSYTESNIRKKEDEKLEKRHGLREDFEKMWMVKATMVLVAIRTAGAVTSKLGAALQEIPGTTPLSRRAQS